MPTLRRVCLFGGSFDPVHAGHLQLAQTARKACGLDEVVFLPAACSPFKLNEPRMFNDAQRTELLRMELEPYAAWARVSELDLKLPPPSWTWRLVEEWCAREPKCELFWLLGGDQWELLPKWARYEQLRQQLHFIVYHRAGAHLEPREGVRASFIEGAEHPASSSVLRDCLKRGKKPPEGWLSTRALAYIRS